MAYLTLQYSSAALSGMTTVHIYLPSDAMSGSAPEPPLQDRILSSGLCQRRRLAHEDDGKCAFYEFVKKRVY